MSQGSLESFHCIDQDTTLKTCDIINTMFRNTTLYFQTLICYTA
jgi:hypothetical protein